MPKAQKPDPAKMTYADASEELDEIVEYFEDADIDVDQLVEQLTRATALVDELEKRLTATKMQVDELAPRLAQVADAAQVSIDPETGEVLDD
jgi:exodeoxyribonuclease VII small subunit